MTTTRESALAVSYIRVSTKEQAERDGDPEGYSLPAQRAANERKAAMIGAQIVAEFPERGESAKSADRPKLQEMLRYIAEHPVDYVIVHKVDRLARNRADDVAINLAIQNAGAKLVSATENIDETASGMLLHGIMSSIAEFYSRNLATEVIKGMEQKAKTGGTPGLAPLGYRNVGTINSEGREVRTVELDPDRAPLITWAFQQYATGEWTIRQLTDALEAHGLTSRGTRKRPGAPIRVNSLAKILKTPYYKGTVTYRGAAHPGRHVPLIDADTWQRVQEVLESHKVGERSREHPHYLKSTVFCGTCGSRLIVTMAKNGQGRIYPYYICIGRQQKRTACQQKALHVATVEELVEDAYRGLQLTTAQQASIRELLTTELSSTRFAADVERRDLTIQRDRLLTERTQLLRAHYADAVPLDLLKSEQDRIARQLAEIDTRLAATDTEISTVEANLEVALRYASNCHAGYLAATDQHRRLYNQAFFTRIEVHEDRAEPTLREPFRGFSDIVSTVEVERQEPGQPLVTVDDLLRSDNEKLPPCGESLNKTVLVPPVRLELTLDGF